MDLKNKPLFNLMTVVRETGLPAATLRAWERRYGLPNPARSSGGQRLYSEHDIALLRWLAARLDEGVRIRQAVDQLHSLESAGLDPLANEPRTASFVSRPAPSGLAELREEWLRAMLAFDEPTADLVLNRAFTHFSQESVCLHILQEGLSQIGRDWYEGRVSVQQEHFISALAVRRLETLFSTIPGPTRNHTVLVGCPAGEWHTFAPLLLVFLLRLRGLHVFYLGADLPVDHLVQAVLQINPDLVVLTAQTLRSAASLLPAASALRADRRTLAFGGWIFSHLPTLHERVPAHYLGDQLEQAVLEVERLLNGDVPAIQQDTLIPNPSFKAALEAFRYRRALIETDLLDDPALAGFTREQLWQANLNIGSDIEAALELGDLAFLEWDLNWIRHMAYDRLTGDRMEVYLRAFLRALRRHLGEAGRPLVEWGGWGMRADQGE